MCPIVKRGKQAYLLSKVCGSWKVGCGAPLLLPLAQAYTYVYTGLSARSMAMTTIKIGVREFRERIASFLESDSPVAVTRRGETLGVYVPTRRNRPKTADVSELKAAADRLAETLADIDEEEVVAEFSQLRRRGKGVAR
jgi:ABC-type anion transport system duplicated permease subunit